MTDFLDKWILSKTNTQRLFGPPAPRDAPARFKPRQPRDLGKIKEMIDGSPTNTEVFGVVALKRDGWFVEIRITKDDTYHIYGMGGGQIEFRTSVFHVPTMRKQMPPELQRVPVTLYGELYVLQDEASPSKDGGHDLVRSALGKKCNKLHILHIDVFWVYQIGDIYGVRIRRYIHQLRLLECLLTDQVQVAKTGVIPYVEFSMMGGKLKGYGRDGKRKFFDTFPDQADVCKGMDFGQFYEGLKHYAHTLQVEGFVVTMDHTDGQGVLCPPKFALDAQNMYRFLYQIKCKTLYRGVFYVTSPSGYVTDTNGTWVGKANLDHSEKGFRAALQARCVAPSHAAKVWVTGSWITCTDDKYTLIGIKYLWVSDIITNDSTPTDTLKAISSQHPHWVSVQEQKRVFHLPASAPGPSSRRNYPVLPVSSPGARATHAIPDLHFPQHSRLRFNPIPVTEPGVDSERAAGGSGAGGGANPGGVKEKPDEGAGGATETGLGGAHEGDGGGGRGASPMAGAKKRMRSSSPSGASGQAGVEREQPSTRPRFSLKGYIDLPSEGGAFDVGRWVRIVMKKLEKAAVETSELSRFSPVNDMGAGQQPFYQLIEIFNLGRHWELAIRDMMEEMTEKLCEIDTNLWLRPEARADSYQTTADEYSRRVMDLYTNYIGQCAIRVKNREMPYGLKALIGQLESLHIRTTLLERKEETFIVKKNSQLSCTLVRGQ